MVKILDGKKGMEKVIIFHPNNASFVWYGQEPSFDFHYDATASFDKGDFGVSNLSPHGMRVLLPIPP